MHLLLHIGQPKTGTSALQRTLLRNRDALLEQGIFYPAASTGAGHHPMVVRFFPRDMWPRLVKHDEGVNPGSVRNEAERLFETISREIDRGRANTIVLSAEYLFRPLAGEGKESARRWIETGFDSCDVVCYVRRPSDQYLSNCLQVLRHSSTIPLPAWLHVRRAIESWADVANIHVCKYERGALAGENIVEDFVSRFLPQVDFSAMAHARKDANVALTAEAAAILQAYRARFHPGSDDALIDDANALARRLGNYCRKEPFNRAAVLRDEIRQFIDHGSGELAWLDERFGLRFEGLDYSRVGSPQVPAPCVRTVEDICHVDNRLREALLMELVRDGVRSRIAAKKERDFLRARAKRLKSRMEKILSSRSWLITAPIRAAGRWLRALTGKGRAVGNDDVL